MEVMLLESTPSSKERSLAQARYDAQSEAGLLPWVLAFLLNCLFLGGGSALGAEKPISLIATGNHLGNLGPCGCPTDPKGGLDRLAEWKSVTKAAGLWVDSGQNLFPFEELNPDLAAEWKAKAGVMGRAYRQLGVQFGLPAANDFAAGKEFLKNWYENAGMQAVAANLVAKDDNAFWSKWKEWKHPASAERWAITGVVAVDTDTAEIKKWAEVLESRAALSTVMAEIRSAGIQNVVVLSSMAADVNSKIALIEEPRFIVTSSADISDKPARLHSTWMIQNRREAQSVFHSSGEGTQETVQETFLSEKWSPKSVAAVEVRSWVEQLNRANRVVAVKKTQKTAKQGKGEYVANPYLCKTCHLPQYQFWEKTQHSSAYLALFSKNQHFDAECVGCHSVGFQEKAGFSSIADPLVVKGAAPRKAGEKPVLESVLETVFKEDGNETALDSRTQPERYSKLKARYHSEMDARAANPGWSKVYIGVSCENCHGNRHAHFASAVKKRTGHKITATTCLQCHTAQRDPEFAFKTDLPKVACPRIQP
jgi:hypothetical protein